MKLTVQKLANLAGVSVRALHHYDQIGLLKPSLIGENGYRYYEDKEINTLRTIMFYQELEFSLSEIKQIISSPKFNLEQALNDQKQLLKLKSEKIQKLMKTIDDTLKTNSHQVDFSSFSDEQVDKYKDEVKARWGNTDAYKQSQERLRKMSKEELKQIGEKSKQLSKELAEAMDLPITDSKVESLIKRHHQGIEIFYDLSNSMYRNLAQMYVTDPRFTTHYDTFRPGLAQFICDAILYYYK